MLCFKKSKDSRKCSGRTWCRGLIALAFLLAVAVPLSAQDWVGIGVTNEGSFCYLNRRSIEDRGSYVTGWIRCEMSNAMKSMPNYQMLRSLYNREPSYLMELYGAQKNSRQIRLLQRALYDTNGVLMVSLDPQDMQQSYKWEYFVPNSIGEFIWKALMDAAGIRY